MQVFDRRPDGHGSFAILPKLGINEYAKLKDFFKFQIHTTHGRDLMKVGQHYWQVVGFDLQNGDAQFAPIVFLDKRDHPSRNILVYENWPDSPPLPNNQ